MQAVADGFASGVQGATSWLAVSPNWTSQRSLSLTVAEDTRVGKRVNRIQQ